MRGSQGAVGADGMGRRHSTLRWWRRTTAMIGAAALFVGVVGPVGAAERSPASAASLHAAASTVSTAAPGWAVRDFPAAPDLTDVTGLTFDTARGELVVSGRDAGGNAAVATVSLDDRRGSPAVVDGAAGPIGDLSYDAATDSLTLATTGTGDLSVVDGGAVRNGTPGTPAPHPVGSLKGVTFASITTDPATGDLFGLIEGTTEVLRIFGGDPADRKGPPTTSIILAGAPETLTSIAFNPADGYLYLTGPSENMLVYDADGALVGDLSLDDAGVVAPTAMAFAPSGDPTDPSSDQSLYVLDDRSSLGGTTQIVEVSFEAAATPAAITVNATLVASTNTFEWSPPSPDPAGITYLSDSGRLLISDSEVNEIPTLWAGVNLFEVTTAGGGLTTGVTPPYFSPYPDNLEPTGLSIAPNGHLFFSDDDRDEIYEITGPGPDAVWWTADDPFTHFDTNGFGSTDPEGVEFDPITGDLFIVDGLGKEIYRVDAGPNGLFDGVDDVVTHFDIEVMGAQDPEGLGIDPDRGVLLVADRPTETVIEFTRDAELIRTIDLNTNINPKLIASVTLAPGSITPTDTNMYITDRAIDNDFDPTENDGVLYEVSAPANTVNVPPFVMAGPNRAVVYPDAASLDGTATDDGLPNPPATLTTTWTKVSGPGTVTFADATAVDTTATFSTPGTYVLQLEANDSAESRTDTVTVEVGDPTGPFTLTTAVAAGSDDAEERVASGGANGTMVLDSPDLDMTLDTSGATYTTGLRFVLDLDPAADITSATIQFQTDEVTTAATDLTIHGEASDDAATFTLTAFDMSSRASTTASVAWSPPAWNTVDEAGPAQQTPDLTAILNEIISRPGWAQGNAVLFTIDGAGQRIATSFEAGAAPVLTVDYTMTGPTPEVTVVATDPAAAEAGTDPGEFTVSRTGSTAAPLTVNYAVSGTATPVDDYAALPGAVEIPAGAVSAPITVIPVDDSADDPDETVNLTLSADAAYTIGSSNTDTVTITDDDADTTPPVITLLGGDPQTVALGNPYNELRATAVDDVDGDISADIVIDASAVDTNTVGSYQVTYDVSDAAGNPATQVIRTVDVVAPLSAYTVDFSTHSVLPYGSGQDINSTFSVEDAGASLRVTANGWKKIGLPTLIKSETVLEFDYSSSVEGEIHGIGFDIDDWQSPDRAFEVFGTQTWGLQDYRTYVSPTVTHYTIPVGTFYTGNFNYLFFINDDDGAAAADGTFTNVVVTTPPPSPPPSPPTGAIDFSTHTVESYGGSQDAGSAIVSGGGYSLELSGDAWKKITLPTVVQAGTVLEFDYSSSVEGEIHGIGFDTNNSLSQDQTFEVFGTQTWGLQDYATYVMPGWTHYAIPVGTFYTGTYDYLFFVNDDDASGIAEGTFANVVITSPPPPPGAIDFSTYTVESYGGSQDAGSFEVLDDGASLRLSGNAWKKIAIRPLLKPDSVLDFDYSSSARGEIHGIGLDTDDVISPDLTFQLFGTQIWGIQDYATYVSPNVTHYTIPIGLFYTGRAEYLFFVNDDDRAAIANGTFTNVVITTP